MVGGSEYPDQSLPDGRGTFVFESFDPETDGFVTQDARELFIGLTYRIGGFDLIRTSENEWYAETPEGIAGKVIQKSAVFDCLAYTSRPAHRNGTPTALPLKPAFDRGGCRT